MLRLRLPHRHTEIDKPDVGKVVICHGFKKVLSMAYKYPGGGWHNIPVERYQQALSANSPEELMAIIRTTAT